MTENHRIYITNEGDLVGIALKQKIRNTVSYQNYEYGFVDQIYVPWFNSGGIAYTGKDIAGLMESNLQNELKVVNVAKQANAKLLYLASSCIYPKDAIQPLREESLFTGPLDPSVEYYALAKLVGIKLCQAYRKQYGCHFISAIPSGIYGPNDDFDAESSHVIGALIRKFAEVTKYDVSVATVWGSGKPKRDFVYVDDLVDAMMFLMEDYDEAEPINIGSGGEVSIEELAWMIADIAKFDGDICFDTNKPDGVMRKMLDTSKMEALGWKPKVGLSEGLEKTYKLFNDNYMDG